MADATSHIGLRCPECLTTSKQDVVDSRAHVYGVRRRRKCSECGARYSTHEIPQAAFEMRVRKHAAQFLTDYMAARLKEQSEASEREIHAQINTFMKGWKVSI